MLLHVSISMRFIKVTYFALNIWYLISDLIPYKKKVDNSLQINF